MKCKEVQLRKDQLAQHKVFQGNKCKITKATKIYSSLFMI